MKSASEHLRSETELEFFTSASMAGRYCLSAAPHFRGLAQSFSMIDDLRQLLRLGLMLRIEPTIPLPLFLNKYHCREARISVFLSDASSHEQQLNRAQVGTCLQQAASQLPLRPPENSLVKRQRSRAGCGFNLSTVGFALTLTLRVHCDSTGIQGACETDQRENRHFHCGPRYNPSSCNRPEARVEAGKMQAVRDRPDVWWGESPGAGLNRHFDCALRDVQTKSTLPTGVSLTQAQSVSCRSRIVHNLLGDRGYEGCEPPATR